MIRVTQKRQKTARDGSNEIKGQRRSGRERMDGKEREKV